MPNSIYSVGRAVSGIEFMNDDSLVKAIAQFSQSNVQLHLENEVFQLYLSRMQPELLLGLQQAIETLEAKENRIHAVASLMNQRVQSTSSFNSLNQSGVSAGTSPISASKTHVSVTPSMREAPHIEIAHRVEMASRETDELKRTTLSFRNATRLAKADRNAAIEGLRLARRDVKLFSDEFVERVLKDKDATNSKIPAEKFVRFVETMIKFAETEITKTRLKSHALFIMGRRVQVRLKQKRELGGSLRPVDYYMLKIETDEQIRQLDKSGVYLKELKGSIARAKSQLINMKNTLQEQEATLNNINKSIIGCDAAIQKTTVKTDEIYAETTVAAAKLHDIKVRRHKVFTPDTMEYLKVKVEVSSLKKDIKMWTRKIHVQHATLVTYKNRIKTLARRRKSAADSLER